MIFKRAIAKLRAQDWTAILIEMGIVVVGVFIGTWVAGWNAARAEEREVLELTRRIQPQIAVIRRIDASAVAYYATTGRYADTALKGWDRDATVSDRDFVVAAYQASQVIGYNLNGNALTAILGADSIPKIEDEALQSAMGQLFSLDFSNLSYEQMFTDYRKHVRQVIPTALQEAIRKSCGDRRLRPGESGASLPATCDVALDADAVRETAATLRTHDELPAELRYHIAQAAAYLFVVETVDQQLEAVEAAIRKADKA